MKKSLFEKFWQQFETKAKKMGIVYDGRNYDTVMCVCSIFTLLDYEIQQAGEDGVFKQLVRLYNDLY